MIAALHPEETDALFFVATGDGNGAHHFSTHARASTTAPCSATSMRLRRDAAGGPLRAADRGVRQGDRT